MSEERRITALTIVSDQPIFLKSVGNCDDISSYVCRAYQLSLPCVVVRSTQIALTCVTIEGVLNLLITDERTSRRIRNSRAVVVVGTIIEWLAEANATK